MLCTKVMGMACSNINIRVRGQFSYYTGTPLTSWCLMYNVEGSLFDWPLQYTFLFDAPALH